MISRTRNFSILVASLLPLQALVATEAQAEGAYEFTYTGRLTDSGAKPVSGPVALKATFYHDLNGQNPILAVTDGLQSINLQQGIFNSL